MALLACLFAFAPIAHARPDLPARSPADASDPGSAPARHFAFDGEFRADPGLRFTFSRPYETVDPTGVPVGPDEPRYAAPILATPVPAVEQIRSTPNNILLLGSGYDHDGVTPLLVVLERSFGQLDVFFVADDLLPVAEQTGVGRVRVYCYHPFAPVADVMRGANPDKAYRPRAGVVCHGLIVLACEVYDNTVTGFGAWPSVAQAFAVSEDRGLTWRIVYEDAVVQPGVERMREWSMQNWWPMARGQAPLEAWFAAADYRYKEFGPTGGRLMAFRAARAVVGGPWGLEPGFTPISVNDGLNEHLHCGGVVPFGEKGVRIFAGVGDGFYYRRIVTATTPQRNYLEPAWSFMDNYFGSLFTRGSQFVGCAPGPMPGSALLGSDENADQYTLIQPDQLATSRASVRLVQSMGYDNGLGSRNFVIRTPTPELGGPYVATFASQNNEYGSSATRLQWSPDGLRWADVYSPGTSPGFSAAIHGSHIYMDSGSDLTGLRRFRVPDVRPVRPLVVAPAGQNRAQIDAAPPTSGDATGEFRLLTPQERAALVPQPPTEGPVYYYRKTPSHDRLLGRIRPAGEAPNFPPGNVHARLWFMTLGHEAAAFRIRVLDGLGNSSPPINYASVTATDGWWPLTLRRTFVPGSIYTLNIEVNADEEIDVMEGYFTVESVFVGNRFPDIRVPAGQTLADERASLCGFQCGQQWNIVLAGALTPYGWDATTRSPPLWPLATLMIDGFNYIELIGDGPNRALIIRFIQNGMIGHTATLPAFWQREGHFRVALSVSSHGTEVLASINHAAQRVVVVEPTYIAGPNRIAFGGPSSFLQGPVQWLGGRIDEDSPIGGLSTQDVFNSLPFLDAPARLPGDANHDCAVNFADLNVALSEYLDRPPCSEGDVTNDGLVDFADLNLILSHFNTACETP